MNIADLYGAKNLKEFVNTLKQVPVTELSRITVKDLYKNSKLDAKDLVDSLGLLFFCAVYHNLEGLADELLATSYAKELITERYDSLGGKPDHSAEPKLPRINYIKVLSPISFTGSTALHIAVMRGHTALALKLINNKANPSLPDHIDDSPLHIAVNKNNVPMIIALCQNGANPNAEDLLGSSPLHIAVRKRKMAAVVALLENGANVDALDYNKKTALHIAASNGYSEIVQILLDHEADPNVQDPKGNTPLHLACERKNNESASKLLANAKTNVNILNNKCQTAADLNHAALKGLFAKITYQHTFADQKKQLIDAAAEWGNQLKHHIKQKRFFDSLTNSTIKSDTSAVENMLLLLQPSRWKSTDQIYKVRAKEFQKSGVFNTFDTHDIKHIRNLPATTQYGLLVSALYSGDLTFLRLLLDTGVWHKGPHPEDWSSIHLALEHPVIIQELIDRGVNPVTYRKDMPLNLAAAAGLTDTVRLLLRTYQHSCKTALEMAIDAGHDEVTKLLLQRAKKNLFIFTQPYSDSEEKRKYINELLLRAINSPKPRLSIVQSLVDLGVSDNDKKILANKISTGWFRSDRQELVAIKNYLLEKKISAPEMIMRKTPGANPVTATRKVAPKVENLPEKPTLANSTNNQKRESTVPNKSGKFSKLFARLRNKTNLSTAEMLALAPAPPTEIETTSLLEDDRKVESKDELHSPKASMLLGI